jgi:hypothetical protein
VRVLAENVHFRLTLDEERSLVRWARTAVAYDAVEQFEDVARATVLALFAIALRFRRDLHHDFARSAVLVRSRAGGSKRK